VSVPFVSPVTVSGLANSYSLTWTTINPSGFSTNSTLVLNNGYCTPSIGGGYSGPVISAILLPNGQQYTFNYDTTQAGTGLLSSIKYPTGEWVEYDWGVNSGSEYASLPRTAT
jgi:hypothetical protein